MGLRTTLFGPPWQHRDADTRAEAVAQLQDKALLAELPKIARTDADATVRRAAIQRITRIDILHECRLQDDDQANQLLASERLIQALCHISRDDEAESSQAIVTRLLDDQPPVKRIEALASHAQHKQIRLAALKHVKRAGFLGDRVLAEPDPELQQQALSQIEQISTLERITKSLRKTNKKLYHQTLQKLEKLQPQKTGARLDDEQALRLCQQLEALARGQGSTHQSGNIDLGDNLQTIDASWQQLSGVDSVIQARFKNTRAILEQALAGPQAVIKPPVKTPGQTPVEVTQDVDQSLQHLAIALNEMLDSTPKKATIENWRQTWRAAWSKLSNPSIADQRLQEELKNRLDKHQHSQQQALLQRAEQQSELDDRINAISKVVEDGQLEVATDQLNALHEQLPRRISQSIRNRLKTIDQQLGELRKWQRWSDNEQRIRLIKTVEKALKDELNADALITLVRDLRTTWQQLEQQEVAHGMRPLAKDHSLARQFNGVCGRAMGQARPFMDNRRKVQDERNELIKTLLNNTHKLLEQEQVDARELIKHKRILGKSFRELPGLPPKQRKKTADAIRKLQDNISERLTASFSAAEAAKRKLIRQAEQLQHATDRQDAIDQAKQLQHQWKSAGPISRKTDQSLWEAFRAQIDPLFASQQQEREQQQAERDAERTQHQQLCEQIETLVKVDDETLESTSGKIEGLQDRWSAQQVFDKGLQQRFNKASEKFEQRLQSWRNAQREQRQQVRAESAQHRQDAVAVLLQSGSDALDKPQQQSLESLLELSTDDLQKKLNKHDSQAHEMCITAEFLSGLPSPDEHREARMQYQVARLADRMSQRDTQLELSTELRELEQRWHANQPLSPSNYKKLNTRFQKAFKAAQQLAG